MALVSGRARLGRYRVRIAHVLAWLCALLPCRRRYSAFDASDGEHVDVVYHWTTAAVFVSVTLKFACYVGAYDVAELARFGLVVILIPTLICGLVAFHRAIANGHVDTPSSLFVAILSAIYDGTFIATTLVYAAVATCFFVGSACGASVWPAGAVLVLRDVAAALSASNFDAYGVTVSDRLSLILLGSIAGAVCVPPSVLSQRPFSSRESHAPPRPCATPTAS